jgi:KRAB domain-containing zinc finger protein
LLDIHIQGAHGGYIQPVQNQESTKFQLEILENMLNCNFCQESFSLMTELNTHTAAVHREILEATQQVISQEQVAVRENVPPFNCTLCKDSFVKVGHLSKHINSNHKINKLNSGKPFRCKICSSNFLQLSTLDKHMLVQHQGQEHSYDCPECSKTFKYSASLQQHLRIHNAVKLYQCGSCTRIFNWEASLRTHIKKCDGGHVHETVTAKKRKITEKPEVNIEVGLSADPLTVKCSRCGELFSDQGHFSAHTCPGNRGRGRRYRCGKCHLLIF